MIRGQRLTCLSMHDEALADILGPAWFTSRQLTSEIGKCSVIAARLSVCAGMTLAEKMNGPDMDLALPFPVLFGL